MCPKDGLPKEEPELLELTADAAERVDGYLAARTELSRSRIQRMLREGSILINGAAVKPNHVLRAGDGIVISEEPAQPCDTAPEDLPLDVVYEDADICVVNKPQGMVVHPAPGHTSGTLVNALLFHLGSLSAIGGVQRPGIVHRIDRMTSGLLVVAKNDAAHLALSEQFHAHTAHRTYLALVDGNLKEDSGTVDAPIGRHRTDRKRMAVTENGRQAVTHWQVLERFGSHTLLRVSLETGRTHQIRVHMAAIQHPVAGDPVYGAAKPQLGLAGQALHGYRLALTHPATGQRLRFFAPLPAYFCAALQKLGCAGELQRFVQEDGMDATKAQNLSEGNE